MNKFYQNLWCSLSVTVWPRHTQTIHDVGYVAMGHDFHPLCRPRPKSIINGSPLSRSTRMFWMGSTIITSCLWRAEDRRGWPLSKCQKKWPCLFARNKQDPNSWLCPDGLHPYTILCSNSFLKSNCIQHAQKKHMFFKKPPASTIATPPQAQAAWSSTSSSEWPVWPCAKHQRRGISHVQLGWIFLRLKSGYPEKWD